MGKAPRRPQDGPKTKPFHADADDDDDYDDDDDDDEAAQMPLYLHPGSHRSALGGRLRCSPPLRAGKPSSASGLESG